MIKSSSYLLFYLLFQVSFIYSSSCEDIKKECVSTLKKSSQTIKSLSDLHKKQMEEIDIFLGEKIVIDMNHDQGIFTVTQKGDLVLYDLDGSLKIVPIRTINFERNTTFEFDPGLRPRPYPYISNVFKLGGGVLYSRLDNIVLPDFSIMYEFFSFDKLLGLYGMSFNTSIGLRHAGITFGYQFYEAYFFKNTSFHIGFGRDYVQGIYSPLLFMSLNF